MRFRLVVVTVTYKPILEELSAFANSFLKYNDLGDAVKLVIVDNSPKSSWNIEKFNKAFSMITIIKNPTNLGFGAANNIGFELFESDYVLFMNNDTEFIQPVFRSLIKICESNNRIGCIGIHQLGGAPSFFPKMTAPKNIDNNHFDDSYHFISGAFMFFRSSAFKECGMFDSNLFLYFEEFDISIRLREKGFCTKYVSKLFFWHKIGNRRCINEKTWKSAVPSFCYICKKYNLDPQYYSKGIMRRLKILLLYHCFLFHIKEAKKIWNVYKFRKEVIYKEFGVKI